MVSIDDWHETQLHWGHESGKASVRVLQENAKEPLEGAEQRTVDDGRNVLPAVRTHVYAAQPPGHLVVELEGAHLPLAPQRVCDEEVRLRPIEPAFALGALVAVRADRSVQCRRQRGLCAGPCCIVTD